MAIVSDMHKMYHRHIQMWYYFCYVILLFEDATEI